MGISDIIAFLQAVMPCIQAKYPLAVSGVTQLVGSASIIAGVLRLVGFSKLGKYAMLAHDLLNKIGLNPATPKQ